MRREESRFLDETVDDRSPTPEYVPEPAVQLEYKQQEKEKQEKLQLKTHQQPSRPEKLPEPEAWRNNVVSPKSEESPPPSPVQSPEFMNSEGEVYKMGTLQLMATAPNHLKKSSDEKLLEEFFGSDHVNKLGIFKSQTSLNATSEGNNSESEEAAENNGKHGGRMAQGVSMPNISTPPSSSPHVVNGQQQHQQRSSPYKQYEASQPSVQRRLQIPRNPNTDANRMSYDVASEMEKLRARLQETAIQELAEFDRKYSPKFIHASGGAGFLQVGGVADSFDGRRSGEISLNHSRQGSLDSSMSSQPTSSTNLINGTKIGGSSNGGGHVRQYSLPIDPNYFRQLQQEQSSNGNTPPNMSPRGMRTAGVVIGRKVSGSSSGRTHHISPSINNLRSPSPPLVGHVRQVSGASAGSSEGGMVSPPLVIGSSFKFPAGMGRLGDGADPKGKQQSKPPGMTRIPSNGSQKQQQQHSSLSMSSPAGMSSLNNSNSNNRHSPEAQFPASQSYANQPHYSTGALKRGKRNSAEIQGDQVSTYQSLYHHNQQHQQPPQHQQHVNASKPLAKTHSYDEKVRQGFRPHTYEKLSTVRDQLEADVDGNGLVMEVNRGSRYQEGGVAKHQPHPRMDTSKLPASPRMGRAPMSSSFGSNGKLPSEDIQPYMTSAQLKQQMKSYTPFSSHMQQQRAYSMSAADPPRLQKRGSGSSGSVKSVDQRTWI